MKKAKHILLRTYLIYTLVLIAMGFVVVKTFYIIVDGREQVFNFTGNNLKEREVPIEPRRGDILDDHLSPLVTSVSYYDIYMDPVTVKDELWNKDVEGLCVGLSKIFPSKTAREYEEYLRTKRRNGNRFVLIKKGVTHEVRQKLRKLPIFEHGMFSGGLIDNKVHVVRKKPSNDLLARTVGYVKMDEKDTLLVGLEGAYNEYLAGQEGITVEKLIGNSWKPSGNIVREAINGYDLVTSINLDIQEVAHNELKQQLMDQGGDYGVAIVMDVKTGFIKAMVSLQKVGEKQYASVYNHAIGTREVPGSTMKLASLLAALEDGKIKLTDTVNAKGRYRFYDQTLTDSRREGYGKISIERAFELSSNVISKVIYDSYKNEPQKYLDRLKQFGITEKTGIQIKGETTPLYSQPGEDSWWGGSLGWLAIGYEFQLTPLQLLSFYNAVANDGKYMQPQLATKVISNGKVIKEFKPIVKHAKIASQHSIDIMKQALEGVVEDGTGKRLQSSYFKIAGKTGTAQLAYDNKGYGKPGEKKYIASFTGYFPADDPIYSCIVQVSAPTKSIYGATVSGTVFTEIANKVYASSYQYHDAVNDAELLVSIPKVQNGSRYDINTVLNYFEIDKELKGSSDWIRTEDKERKIVFNNLPIDKNKVPSVYGMGLTDAIYLLEKQGLVVKTNGYGSVFRQSIRAGREAVPGEVITLTLR